jgi:hypothetical protein
MDLKNAMGRGLTNLDRCSWFQYINTLPGWSKPNHLSTIRHQRKRMLLVSFGDFQHQNYKQIFTNKQIMNAKVDMDVWRPQSILEKASTVKTDHFGKVRENEKKRDSEMALTNLYYCSSGVVSGHCHGWFGKLLIVFDWLPWVGGPDVS